MRLTEIKIPAQITNWYRQEPRWFYTHTHTHTSILPFNAFLLTYSTLFKQNLRRLSSDIGITLHFTFHCQFYSSCGTTSSDYIPRSQPPQVSTDHLVLLNLGHCVFQSGAIPLEPQLFASCCERLWGTGWWTAATLIKRKVQSMSLLLKSLMDWFMCCIWAQKIYLSFQNICMSSFFLIGGSARLTEYGAASSIQSQK